MSHTPYSASLEWNRNIINNLRREFPKETEHMSDINILDEYDEYSMSDKELTFGEWVS